MLAASRISKLQKEKARPRSAGSRPKSAGGGRPRSAGSTRAASRQGIPEYESSVFAEQNSVLEDSGNLSLSESLERGSSGQTLSNSEASLDQKYQIDYPLEDDPIREWSAVNHEESADVLSESLSSSQMSNPSIFTASSHKIPEQSTSSSGAASTASVNKHKRPASGARRKSQSAIKKRPKSASGKRRGSASSLKRPARRMENKYARRMYKEEVKQAKKPNLEGDCMTKVRALWIMFVMSFVPKILTAIGLIVLMLGIILMGIGTNVEANYPEGKALGAVMFVLGLGAVVVGLVALKIRRIEKKKMRGMAAEQAREKYTMNGLSNGDISIISNDITFSREHQPHQKMSFTVIENEESGFTNLAAIVDDYHLPGSPYRQRRRESIEATMKQMSPRQDEPDMLFIQDPTSSLNPPKNKSHGGKNVKKSKGNLPQKPTLTDIPEVVVTAPSPRNKFSEESSLRANSSQNLKKLIDEDETAKPEELQLSQKTSDSVNSSPLSIRNAQAKTEEEDSWDESADELGSSQNKANELKERSQRDTNNGAIKANYMNMGFEEGDIVPEDLD